MLVAAKKWTEEELMALPKEDGKYELVDGELSLMSPAGNLHGFVCVSLIISLGSFVKANKLGAVYEGQTGFWMKNGNLRSPDVSYVAQERLDSAGGIKPGFLQIAPDLAIEVISPTETSEDVRGKIADYFDSGTRLVWVLNLRTKTTRVYRQPKNSTLLSIDECLDGQEVVPGFLVPIRELYEPA